LKSFLKVFLAGGAMMATLAFAGGPAQAEPVVASWYGAELAGNPTASGEPFNPGAMTAAHPSLPFGTQVEVCYQGCAVVTINDRGPFVAGRGIDLSQAAAQAIGLSGVDTVEMNVVGSGGAATGATDTAATGGYAYDPYTGVYYDPYAVTY
jgi:rare lipoprotein A